MIVWYKLGDWLTGIQVQVTFINCLNQERIAKFSFNIFVNSSEAETMGLRKSYKYNF